MNFPTIKQLFEDIVKKESMKDDILKNDGENITTDKEDNVYKKTSTNNINPGGQFAQGF